MAQAGNKLRVRISTVAGGAGAYTVIAGVKQATMRLNGQNVDITTLTDADVRRLAVLKDCSYQLSGNYETDAGGQGALRTAYENGTEVWIQFLPDGVAGWKQQFYVANYEMSGSPESAFSFSADLEGSGAKGVV